MLKVFTRLAGAALAAACLASGTLAQSALPSRALALEDITALESFGRGAVSPDGRWAVYEKRGPYDSIARFEFEWRSTWTIMDLWRIDMRNPSSPPQLLLPGEGPGLQTVAWSPSGDRLLVSRLRGRSFEYGVVSVAEQTVRWTGLTPDVQRGGASAAWVSADRVMILVRPDHSLPAALRHQGESQTLISLAWERTALGREPSRTVIDARAGQATTQTPSPARALVLLDTVTHQTSNLTEGQINDFAISPDGRHVAVVEAGEGAVLSERELVQFDSRDRQRLSFLDLTHGEMSGSPDSLDVAPGLLRWSPNSQTVLVWARRDGQSWNEGRLVRASSDGTEALNIDGLSMGSAEAVMGVRADWLGNDPVIYAKGSDGERADWRLLSTTTRPRTLTGSLRSVPARIANANGHSLFLFADGSYWILSRDGTRRLTGVDAAVQPTEPSDRELVARLKTNEAPRRPWAIAQSPDGESVVLATDGAIRPLGRSTDASPPGLILAASPDGVLFLRRTGLSETLFLRTAFGEYPIDTVNKRFSNVALVTPTAVSHQDLEGRETQSWLFLPPEGVPFRGLIVRVYPGATDKLVWFDPLTLTYAFGSQVLAAAGYAVLSPVIPTGGPIARRGDDIVRSVDLAVDAALAAFPQLPKDRMAVMGHSFGGYATLEIAARSHRYRSFIASSAFSDMFGMWGEFDPATRILSEDGGMIRATQGWTEVGQGGLGGPPWASPDQYAASSPYLLADRISSPVLILAADMDFVPLSQAERMYSALLRTGGRARLVTYWGEHHIFWSPANIQDRYRQIFDWLDLTLAEPDTVSPPNRADAPSSEPNLPEPPPP